MPVQVGSAYGKIDIDASGIRTSLQSASDSFEKVEKTAQAAMNGISSSLGAAQKAANNMAAGLTQMKASFTAATPASVIQEYNLAKSRLEDFRAAIKNVSAELKSDSLDPSKLKSAFEALNQTFRNVGSSSQALKGLTLPKVEPPNANQWANWSQMLSQGMTTIKDKALDLSNNLGGSMLPGLGRVTSAVAGLSAEFALVAAAAAVFLAAIVVVVAGIKNALDTTLQYSRSVHELGEVFGLSSQSALAYTLIMKRVGMSVEEGSSGLNIFVRNVENARWSADQAAEQTGTAMKDLLSAHTEALKDMAQTLVDQQRDAGENILQAWADFAERRAEVETQLGRQIADINHNLEKQLADMARNRAKQLEDFRKQSEQIETDAKKEAEDVEKDKAKSLKELDEQRLKDQQALTEDYAARINAAGSKEERALLRRELEAKKAQLAKDQAQRKKEIEDAAKERKAEIEQKRKERQEELAERRKESEEEFEYRRRIAREEADERIAAARLAAKEQIAAAEKAAARQEAAIRKALEKQEEMYKRQAEREEKNYARSVTRINEQSKKQEVATPFLKALKTLGISIDEVFGPDGSVKPMDEWFPKIALAFSKLPDGPKKIALAMQLFGENGAEWIPFLEKFAAEYEKTIGRLKAADIDVDPDGAKRYKAAWADFNEEMDLVKIKVGNRVLPYLTSATSGFAKLASGALRGVQGDTKGMADSWGAAAEKILPRISSVVKDLQSKYGPAVGDLAKTTKSKLDEARANWDSWSSGMTSKLTEYAATLRDRGSAMWEEFKSGASTKLDELKNTVLGFWGSYEDGTGLLGWFKGLKDKFYQAGVDIFNGLVAGLEFMKDKVGNALAGPIQALIDLINSLLKIHSPSGVFRDMGRQMMAGMALGLEESAQLPEAKLRRQLEVMINQTQLRGTNAPSTYRFYGPMYITLSGANANMQEFLKALQAMGAGV